MTREQLILLAGTALVLLINFIRRMRQRRVQGEAPRREADVSERPRPTRRPPQVVTPPRRPMASDTPPRPLTAPRVTPRPRIHAPLGGLRAVRHGIVLMTILGPCRALEPPNPQS